jgi:hypothetical protein
MHLYSLFNSFCGSEPRVQEISLKMTGNLYSKVDKIIGKLLIGFKFFTKSLPRVI